MFYCMFNYKTEICFIVCSMINKTEICFIVCSIIKQKYALLYVQRYNRNMFYCIFNDKTEIGLLYDEGWYNMFYCVFNGQTEICFSNFPLTMW